MSRTADPYEYVSIPVNIKKDFKLDYDIKPTHFAWAGDFHLGLFSEDMIKSNPHIMGELANPDEGKGIYIEGQNSNNVESGTAKYGDFWELNEWVHVTLEYNKDESTMSLKTYPKSDISNIQIISVESIGDYDLSLNGLLGATTNGLTPYQNSYVEGYVDNVKLVEV